MFTNVLPGITIKQKSFQEESPMVLAILSDTHNLLRPQVLTRLQGADAILHGGDCSKQAVLDTLI